MMGQSDLENRVSLAQKFTRAQAGMDTLWWMGASGWASCVLSTRLFPDLMQLPLSLFRFQLNCHP